MSTLDSILARELDAAGEAVTVGLLSVEFVVERVLELLAAERNAGLTPVPVFRGGGWGHWGQEISKVDVWLQIPLKQI